MPIMIKNNFLKWVVIYVYYNYFLKILFVLINNLLYINLPEQNIRSDIFRQHRGDEMWEKLISIIFGNIAYDLIWVLPYTIMNLYIFVKLLRMLNSANEFVLQKISFTILKKFTLCCVFHLCFVGFEKLFTDSNQTIYGPYAPYGSFTITYLLLGNFVFLVTFVPLWNKFIGSWIKK